MTKTRSHLGGEIWYQALRTVDSRGDSAYRRRIKQELTELIGRSWVPADCRRVLENVRSSYGFARRLVEACQAEAPEGHKTPGWARSLEIALELTDGK